MRRRIVRPGLVLVASLATPFVASTLADVSLPPLFSAHAVLQQAASVPVWGKAAPGERVSVTLGPARVSTSAGPDGRWKVELNLAESAAGPFELVVKGDNTLVVPDVLVGEVWFASGQSNMEWVLRNTTGAGEEIARSANPRLRHFLVKKNTSPVPIEDLQGEWKIADPATTGDFTAVGYYFAKALNRATGRPFALVHASWGGTKIEAWTSPEGLARLPEVQASADRYREEEQQFPSRVATFPDALSAWSKKHDRADEAGLDVSDALAPDSPLAWRPVDLSATAPIPGLPVGGGVVWLRREVEVPAANAGLAQPLDIGRVNGFYAVYFDGVKIGEVTPRTGMRRPGAVFYVKETLMTPGRHVLALRIYNPAGQAVGAADRPLRFIHRPIPADWQVAIEREFPAPDASVLATIPVAPIQPMNRQDIGAYLYNAMVHPVIPYAIRGVIWYQGEGNAGRAAQYRASFPNLIADWRARWRRGDVPFYFCQLANFGGKNPQARDDATAELRDAQSLALRLPGTGRAVLIDIGEADDIHPRNKREAGERLARIALANTYGQGDVTFSGPVYASHRIDGGLVRVTFTGATNGLVAKELPVVFSPRSTAERTLPLELYSPGSELQGFAICGEDRRWIWAQARIEDDAVIVSSPAVKSPVAVRYGWAGNPTCNLYDGAGLPASPFRTDDFPLITRDARY